MAPLILKKDQVIGKWRLDARLGSGGQGTVWRVRYVDDKHSPEAALKICSGTDEKARARFEREARLLGEQDHPGIVRVRYNGTYGGSPYFVMEAATTTLARVTGTELVGNRLIRESRELLFRFLRQACEGVAYLHSRGVLHRDLKPSNILLMLEPPEPLRAVVADLGIASVATDQGALTATHETIGTPAFRAPETLNGVHTTRSDVYSLGKTMEAVLNRGAPVELGPGKCLRDHRVTAGLWDTLDEVLMRACSFDPAARYEDAAELLQALPEVVLDLEHNAPAVRVHRRSTPALKAADYITLADVIAACRWVDNAVGLYMVQHRSKLTEYRFALAVHRLADIGFLRISSEEDERGEKYPTVSPTAAAFMWAQEHEQDMEAAIAEFAPRSGDDDEIPF